jgi:hypothetical protein
LLIIEDFGGWQDRDPFFGVVEGYVWIGSTKTFPLAQIVIVSLSVCLLYIAYVSYIGYSKHDEVSMNSLQKAYRLAMIEIGITIFSAILFVIWVK